MDESAAAPHHRSLSGVVALAAHVTATVGALRVLDTLPRRDEESLLRRLAGLAHRLDVDAALHLALADPGHPAGAAADVAHEIRTPVTSIRGYLELILDTPGAEPDRYAAHVAVINRNAARLTRTVEHLMHVALARQGRVPLSRRPVDLAELVGRCVRRRPEGGDRIVVRAPDTAVVVAVDARQLTRAVDNLLANACLFGAADAPVTVTVTAGRGACVDVRDHGPGIAPDELAHVGTPFFRGVRARAAQLPGLGLGLAVTRQIMQAHGGDVAVASAVGRGTHTRLRLAG